MKLKKIFFSTVLTFLAALSFSKTTLNANAAGNDETVSYSVDSFTALPADWSLYSQCDVGNTSTSYNNNEMVITNSNTTSNSLYYGSVYYVNTENNWEDFTFEVTVKMTSAADINRWFGIGYHTQEVAGNMVGYLMNYRYGGDSAFSAFNSSKSFFDGDKINSQGVKLNDGKYHTLKVVMEGNTASHYIDDKLVITWDVRERNTHLGGSSLEAGGFALFVNRSTVRIKSVNITGTLAKVSNAPKDETLVTTYQDRASLLNFPTVVTEVNTEEKLNGLLSGDVRPSNAILNVNDNLEVVVGNKSVGELRTVINEKLQKSVIPVVYLKNETQAEKLIEMYDNGLIVDMAIMSNNPAIIKMVKEEYPVIRGIYHVEEYESLGQVVITANSNYAGIVALNQDLVNTKTVSYIHARFKTVWVLQNDETDFELYNTINSGCYGIIVDDYANLYDLYTTYASDTLIRRPFNVAHRGLSSICNENSVYGTQKAIDTGATHVEVDAYLTTDNEIAIMHDSDISRTSNGTGNIETYTLEQLQQFELDLRSPREKIPSLEDIVNVVKDSGVVLVLEIKSNKIKIVEVISQKLREMDMLDQTVIISFNTGILGECKDKLPEVPTANLNEARTTNLLPVLYWMGTYNTGIDTHYTHISSLDNKHILKDRGIIGWYWTYDPTSLITTAINGGVMGITNNSCNYFYEFVKEVEGVSFTLEAGEDITTADFELNTLYYDGYETEDVGELFSYVDMGDYYEVICSYQTIIAGKTATLYTDKFRVEKAKVQTPDNPPVDEPGDNQGSDIGGEQSSGCNGAIFTSIAGVSVLGLVMLVSKKRKENE